VLHLGGVVWSVCVSFGSVRVEQGVVKDGQMGLVYGSITTHKPSHSRGFATLSIVSCWIILRSDRMDLREVGQIYSSQSLTNISNKAQTPKPPH